jgi:hypothetical protein
MPKKERLGFLRTLFDMGNQQLFSLVHWTYGENPKVDSHKKDHLSILTPLFSSGRLRDDEAI